MDDLKISRVTTANVNETLTYVKNFRKQLFPMLDSNKLPKDLLSFNEIYIEDDLGFFVQARNSNNSLIGVVGMNLYDHRFPYLNYHGKRVVEVSRLYIEPTLRRKGIAGLLINTLKARAKAQKVDVLYLHTHPFLTGAFEFWQSQGFKQIMETQEGGFTTIHMECYP